MTATPLSPTRARQYAHAERTQPIAFLDRRKLHVGPRELPRVIILGAVELRAAKPIRPGELKRVADASATLLGRVDHEQTAERPERLTAERRLGLLLEQKHTLTD